MFLIHCDNVTYTLKGFQHVMDAMMEAILRHGEIPRRCYAERLNG